MSSTDRYLRTIRKYTPLSREEQQELFKKAKAGDKAAYEKLITSNLRFVVMVAKSYVNKGLELNELIQEGNYGLIKAYHKFDPSKNYKFITYAVWWIRQSILLALHEHANLIRLPVNKMTNIIKANKLKEELEQELNTSISINDLGEYIDDPTMLEDLKYKVSIIDLDAPQTDDNHDLTEVISSDEDYHEIVEIMQEELDDILKDFTDREKEILCMYYGIGEIRPYTLKEIGYDKDLTRERIRQIKKQVLEKLRDKSYADRLRGYIK